MVPVPSKKLAELVEKTPEFLDAAGKHLLKTVLETHPQVWLHLDGKITLIPKAELEAKRAAAGRK